MASRELRIRYVGDAKGVGKAISDMDRQHSRLGATIGRAGRWMGRAFLAVGAAAVVMAGSVLVAGHKMNAELETATLQFETLLGSAKAAQKHVGGLFKFAAKTPFETQPIIEASRQLQVFGGSALNTKKTLTLVGDAAAAVSAEINEVGFWVGRAYSQIQAGKPFGEAAMRLQELAVLSPKARAEMEKLQASGASTSQVWRVMERDLGRFSGAMEKQASSWKGIWSTLKDLFGIESAKITKPLFEAMKDAGKAVIDFADTPAWDRMRANAQQAVGGVADSIGRVVKAFRTGGLSKAFGQVRKEMQRIDLSKSLSKAFQKVNFSQIIQKLDFGTLMVKMVEGFANALSRINWSKLSEALSTGIIRMATGVDWGAVGSALGQFIIKVVPAIIGGLIEGIFQAIKNNPLDVVAFVAALFPIAKIGGIIAKVVSKIPFVGPLLGAIFRGLQKVGQWLWNAAGKLFGRVGKAAITGIRTGLSSAWGSVVSWFRKVPGWIAGFFKGALRWLVSAGRWIIRGLWNGLKALWSSAVRFFADIPKRILSFFKNAAKWLWNAGKNIIQGLINGIKSAAGGVQSALSAIASKVPIWKGPPAKDRRLLFASGQMVMQGFQRGLLAERVNILRTLGSMSDMVAGFEPRPAMAPLRTRMAQRTAAAASAPSSSGITVIIQGDVYGWEDFKRKVNQATAEDLGRSGRVIR